MISIIIPTFNRAEYIGEAIDSVLAQTYKDYEIIVVDDGSTDNTQKVLEQYEGKIKYFFKENGGEASARNYGIEKAQGEFIAYLDSDDLWCPEKLELQMQEFEKDEKVGLVHTSMEVVTEDGTSTGEYKPTSPAETPMDFLENKRILMCVLVKKEIFSQLGLFDETMRIGVDTDMWLRLSQKYKIKYIDKPLAKVRKHDTNISSDMEGTYLGHVILIEKFLKYHEEASPRKSLLRNWHGNIIC